MTDFQISAYKHNDKYYPAVGTGFAAAFGFGLSREDSFGGFLEGAKRFADEFGNHAELKQVDYNIYAQPNAENAKQVQKLAQNSGVRRLTSGQ